MTVTDVMDERPLSRFQITTIGRCREREGLRTGVMLTENGPNISYRPALIFPIVFATTANAVARSSVAVTL
jgi:hypothetical protein